MTTLSSSDGDVDMDVLDMDDDFPPLERSHGAPLETMRFGYVPQTYRNASLDVSNTVRSGRPRYSSNFHLPALKDSCRSDTPVPISPPHLRVYSLKLEAGPEPQAMVPTKSAAKAVGSKNINQQVVDGDDVVSASDSDIAEISRHSSSDFCDSSSFPSDNDELDDKKAWGAKRGEKRNAAKLCVLLDDELRRKCAPASFFMDGGFWKKPMGIVTSYKDSTKSSATQSRFIAKLDESEEHESKEFNTQESFLSLVWKGEIAASRIYEDWQKPRSARKSLRLCREKMIESGSRYCAGIQDPSTVIEAPETEDTKSMDSGSSAEDIRLLPILGSLRQSRRALEQRVRYVRETAEECAEKHESYIYELKDTWERFTEQPSSQPARTYVELLEEFWNKKPENVKFQWLQNSELFRQQILKAELHFASLANRFRWTVEKLRSAAKEPDVRKPHLLAWDKELSETRYRILLCQRAIIDMTHNIFCHEKEGDSVRFLGLKCRIWDCPGPRKCIRVSTRLGDDTRTFIAVVGQLLERRYNLGYIRERLPHNCSRNKNWRQGPSGLDLLIPMRRFPSFVNLSKWQIRQKRQRGSSSSGSNNSPGLKKQKLVAFDGKSVRPSNATIGQTYGQFGSSASKSGRRNSLAEFQPGQKGGLVKELDVTQLLLHAIKRKDIDGSLATNGSAGTPADNGLSDQTKRPRLTLKLRFPGPSELEQDHGSMSRELSTPSWGKSRSSSGSCSISSTGSGGTNELKQSFSPLTRKKDHEALDRSCNYSKLPWSANFDPNSLPSPPLSAQDKEMLRVSKFSRGSFQIFNDNITQIVRFRRIMASESNEDIDEALLKKLNEKPTFTPWPGYHYYD